MKKKFQKKMKNKNCTDRSSSPTNENHERLQEDFTI